MPTYCMICPICSTTKQIQRAMKDSNSVVDCNCCGFDMQRDYAAEHSSVRGNYNEAIVSESLAFDAIDLAQHRKDFPNVDVDVDGRSARPILRSLSQKRKYLKKRGWVDVNAYT